MKKLLLLGNGNHQFLRYLCKWLKTSTREPLSVDILSTTKVIEESFYDKVFELELSPFINNLPVIGFRYHRWKLHRLFRQLCTEYDIINIHFIHPYHLPLAKEPFNGKLILTFWGSDFYRATPEELSGLQSVVQQADAFSCGNPQMMKTMKEAFINTPASPVIASFGLEPLETMNQPEITREAGRDRFKTGKEKVAVTIGYSLSPRQRHIQIIESINAALSETEKERVHLLIPVTYGKHPDYLRKLKACLQAQNIQYTLFTEFMSNEDIAALRKATDIFIHLQKTDQLSGSMQEHIYAGNIVITGSWLPYDSLREKGVAFRTIDNITTIGNELSFCLNNLEDEKNSAQENSENIYKRSGWPNVINAWKAMYGVE